MLFFHPSAGEPGERSLRWRINHYVDLVRLQHTIGSALGIITAAVVVEHGNGLGRALAVTDANLQSVRSRIVFLDQRLNGLKLRQVNAVLLRYQNVMPAAINRQARSMQT